MSVRTRIAPVPTGDPHVGTAYVALFNYALRPQARRAVPPPHRGHRPAAQPSRQRADDLRRPALAGPRLGRGAGRGRAVRPLPPERALGDLPRARGGAACGAGAAYPCFCTAERLDALRDEQKARKAAVLGYDGRCRRAAPRRRPRGGARPGEAHVVRLAMPEDDVDGRSPTCCAARSASSARRWTTRSC